MNVQNRPLFGALYLNELSRREGTTFIGITATGAERDQFASVLDKDGTVTLANRYQPVGDHASFDIITDASRNWFKSSAEVSTIKDLLNAVVGVLPEVRDDFLRGLDKAAKAKSADIAKRDEEATGQP